MAAAAARDAAPEVGRVALEEASSIVLAAATTALDQLVPSPTSVAERAEKVTSVATTTGTVATIDIGKRVHAALVRQYRGMPRDGDAALLAAEAVRAHEQAGKAFLRAQREGLDAAYAGWAIGADGVPGPAGAAAGAGVKDMVEKIDATFAPPPALTPDRLAMLTGTDAGGVS
jgi:hypothetical protein